MVTRHLILHTCKAPRRKMIFTPCRALSKFPFINIVFYNIHSKKSYLREIRFKNRHYVIVFPFVKDLYIHFDKYTEGIALIKYPIRF